MLVLPSLRPTESLKSIWQFGPGWVVCITPWGDVWPPPTYDSECNRLTHLTFSEIGFRNQPLGHRSLRLYKKAGPTLTQLISKAVGSTIRLHQPPPKTI
ncbi:hypothetical protein AVEN_5122-1 [Araneus ventricosus]|uniref:Uncharacterized protein n=1 Tax=Araneus ventricosus TaxID=182803 RepID=A0A4Y2K337_ARAVE|nr:hypothetical protein AVEN_5122-1 [Araneus ventricosus]